MLPPAMISLEQMERENYFSRTRTDEVLGVLPGAVDRVLDVGCGTGQTLAELKHRGLCNWIAGIEQDAWAAEQARSRLDLLVAGDIERAPIPIPPASLDLILCMDVLEHLVDPWSTVRKLHELLKPHGLLVASLPNVRHARVVVPLVVRGSWTYTQAGLLDRTHLRFFTRATAIRLLESSGLCVDVVHGLGVERGSRSGIANALTLGLFRPFLETQYVLRARNTQPPVTDGFHHQ